MYTTQDIKAYIDDSRLLIGENFENHEVIYGDSKRLYGHACFANIIGQHMGKQEHISMLIRSTLPEDFIALWINRVLGRIWDTNVYFIEKTQKYTITLVFFGLINPSIWGDVLEYLVYYTLVLCRLLDKEWCPTSEFLLKKYHPELLIDMLCDFTGYILATLECRIEVGRPTSGHFFHDPFGHFVWVLHKNKIPIDELNSPRHFLDSICGTLQSRKHTKSAISKIISPPSTNSTARVQVDSNHKPYVRYTAISDALSKEYNEINREI